MFLQQAEMGGAVNGWRDMKVLGGLLGGVVLTMALPLSLVACGGSASPTAEVPGGVPEGAAITATAAITTTLSYTETDLIVNMRQLVFEGRRSGEGYFSSDGRQMIFMSEREPENPFYQMYVLDMETGDSRRISTGIGKTTCGWFHPDGKRVLLASSHDDPEAETKQKAELTARESETGRRYEWAYDDQYEIYEVALEGGPFTNLTNSPGYDAEGSYSPDGTKIAFTSNRLAYTEPMSEEDQALFEKDNGYLGDIYIMDADGGNVTRLTEEKGYDGGPFFSPDGRRIVWRHFDETGLVAEIWTMNIDGSDKRQLTRLGAMSWAPFYHPSGEYVIFTTSLHGYDNFELYMVDVDGAKEPLRVTYAPGPDVLPVFTPDGERLTWVTRRGIEGLGQIFMADWNDALARQLLARAPRQGQVRYQEGGGTRVAADLSATAAEIRAEDARLHVEQLASEGMAGRLTGTAGEAAATAYVAEVFEALGLLPAGDDGFFQPFEFTSGVTVGEQSAISFRFDDGTEIDPQLNSAWRPLAFTKSGPANFSGLAFAGYGIHAPEDGNLPAYDSYGDLDVDGKWVVVLRYLPEDVSPEVRQHLSRYASLRFKAMEARDRGAVGILVVSGPSSQVKDELVPLRFDAAVAGAAVHAASLTDALGEKLLAAAGKDLATVQAALDSGAAVPGFDLPGVQAGAHFMLELDKATGRNVLGRLQIGEAPSAQVVVIGAHVDHLGRGEGGDTLAKPEEQGQIHYGADDNASGVAGLLEIAQELAARERAGELQETDRDILFAAWSGEELGVLGSSHYVKALKAANGDPESLAAQLAAYLNMDMIGRLGEKLVLQGVGSSPFWKPEIERRNVAVGLPIALSDETYLPTDATPFYLAGVPILSAFTGAHEDYHTPRDTAAKLDYTDLARTARLMGLLAGAVSSAPSPPEYVALAARGDANRRVGKVYMGTIPDYAESDVAGVLLSGVSNESPAQKAGIRGGDILVELAGQKLANIYDFTRALDALKVGEEVTVVVLRNGQRLTLKLTPGSRE